jgi:uncharacterized protein (TIGR03067 family)
MNNCRWLAFVFAAFSLGLLFRVDVTGGPFDKKRELKEELKKLEGTWRVIAVQLGGEDMPREEIGPNNLLIVSGEKYTTVIGKRRIECTMTVDPTREPKEIDVRRTSDKVTWLGIYELKGDSLKVFFGNKDKRPTEFKTKEGTEQVFHEFRRVSDD